MKMVHSVRECQSWIENLLDKGGHSVSRVPLDEIDKWGFDVGRNHFGHESGKFFTVRGIDFHNELALGAHWQQPIVDQPEQGILGYAFTQIAGERCYLNQAKLEPGNPGLLQVSPTLQATRSNLTRVHAGKSPKHTEFFVDADATLVRPLVNVPLSETASRFLGKSNFNTVVELLDPHLERDDHFVLIPERVLKELLFIDNLVNMDARSVLSLVMGENAHSGEAEALMDWLQRLRRKYPSVQEIIPLDKVAGWDVSEREIVCLDRNEFKVIGIRTEAKEREVPLWTQPILRHEGLGMCGLLVYKVNGVDRYLIQARPEAGSGAGLELAPTVLCWDFAGRQFEHAAIPFAKHFIDRAALEFAVLHSEEGGRFDHFINDYCLMRIDIPPDDVPENYCWASFAEMKVANVIPGVVSSELRTLITLLGARSQ